MCRVRHAANDRADQHKLLHDFRMVQCEINGDFPAMRTAHNRRPGYLQATEHHCEIVCREISRGGRRRLPVSSAIIPNRVKVLTELRPNIIPRGGMKHSVMNQHYSLRAVTTFFVIKLRSLHFDEGTAL